MNRRILVVGAGGREHALVWGFARSDSVHEVLAAPGNPGMDTVARCVPLDVQDPMAVADLADEVAADLVVIGPEGPLVAGAADAVASRGRRVFGPGAAPARLEGSKAWMKEVLASAGVPTARHATFRSDQQSDACAFLDTLQGSYVVKTDGLAAGKGVVVTDARDEAEAAIRRYLSGEAFGEAGRTLVLEERLHGTEVSLLVVCNGDAEAAVPLAPAQDFKRALDGDTGPNTGGMGAYSPVPIAGDRLIEEMMGVAVRPTLRELASRGAPYRGILYAGIMVTSDGPKVLEYNVRFGDPECQAVVPRLETDLGELCYAAATGRPLPPVRFTSDACVTVVLASEGYPTAPRSGDPILGLDAAAARPDVVVFHAGTTRDPSGAVVTSGGRVLDVTAVGPTIEEARRRAYAAAAEITWPGLQYRHDIAAGA